MIINNIIVLIGLLCLRFAYGLPLLLIGRFITGYTNGSNRSCIGPYTSELCQPNIRKSTATFGVLFFAIGYALLFSLGVVLKWRDVISIIMIFPCLFIILLSFCPKSPTWLMNKELKNKAMAEMIRLRGNSNAASLEIKRLQDNMDNQKRFKKESKDTLHLTSLMLSFKQETVIRPFFVCLVIMTLGLHWTGAPPLSFYLVTTLQKCNVPMEPYLAAAIISCYRLIATIIGTFASTCVRRRPLYIGCCLITASGCFLLGTSAYLSLYDNYTSFQVQYPFVRWFSIFAILLIYTGISGGMTSVAFALFSELLPSNVRSVGTGVVSAIGCVSLFCSTKFTPDIENLCGFHGMFWIYSGVGLGVAIFSYFCIPETFGLELEDVEDHYRKLSNKKRSI